MKPTHTSFLLGAAFGMVLIYLYQKRKA